MKISVSAPTNQQSTFVSNNSDLSKFTKASEKLAGQLEKKAYSKIKLKLLTKGKTLSFLETVDRFISYAALYLESDDINDNVQMQGLWFEFLEDLFEEGYLSAENSESWRGRLTTKTKRTITETVESMFLSKEDAYTQFYKICDDTLKVSQVRDRKVLDMAWGVFADTFTSHKLLPWQAEDWPVNFFIN